MIPKKDLEALWTGLILLESMARGFGTMCSLVQVDYICLPLKKLYDNTSNRLVPWKNQDQRVPPVARQPPINTMQYIQTRGHPCLQAARRILVSRTGRLHHLEAFWPASNFPFNSSLSRAGNSVNVAYFIALVIAGLLCLILFYSTMVMMLGCFCYLSFSRFSPRLACYVNLLSGMEFNASFNLIDISGQIFEAG